MEDGGGWEGRWMGGGPPHRSLHVPPRVVLPAPSIVSHQKLIVVWQTPFISPCGALAPGAQSQDKGAQGLSLLSLPVEIGRAHV